MNRLFIKFAMICILIVACQNEQNLQKKDCSIDPKFLNYYLNDINRVLVFSTKDEQDFRLAYKAFINLEILVNDTSKIDSLSIIFHTTSEVKENLNLYLDKWLNWLILNKCEFTYHNVQKKFDAIRNSEVKINYSDKEFINKLRIKNSILLKSLDISNGKIDTMLVDRYKMAIDSAPPNWD